MHYVIGRDRKLLESWGYTNFDNEKLEAMRERRKDLRIRGFNVIVEPVSIINLYYNWLLVKSKEIEKIRSKFKEEWGE